ncbi:unnamed protein product [Cuscuta campestris]|uniref:CCHC-type domain-containing protein n=1 Tax=Cuscuta campestris TaxID=132261 RepID=A0A484L2T5_9ASTE|nr:unnamed protein product [Cuscuta campestris]
MKEGEKIDALKKTYANKDLEREILWSLTPELSILTPSLDEQTKKGIALKATKETVEEVSSDDDNEFGLVIKKFHKFMKKEFECKGRKHDCPPKCYGCGEIGHIKPRCPRGKNDKDKLGFKKQRAYILWGGDSSDESTDQEEDEASNLCLMAHEDQTDDVQENFSLLSLFFQIHHLFFKNASTMAGEKSKTKASKKRGPAEASSSAPQPFPYLDGSFLEFGLEEELTRFLTHFAKRPISPPRVLPELFPQQKGYHELDNQLQASGLWSFVSKSRTSYNPAIVRALYSNLRRDGDTIYSSINLYDMEIDLPTFARIAELPIRGDDIATCALRTDDPLGPAGEASSSLHPHSDSSPLGRQPHLSLQRGLEGDSSNHPQRLHQMGKIRHDTHDRLRLPRYRAELAKRLPRHGSHRVRRHPHCWAKHEDDEALGHCRQHLQEEVWKSRRRRTESCPCPSLAPTRASLQSIADTLNRLTLTVDGIGQYMERMDSTLQRQHHDMTAFFRGINYVPPPFDSTILGQNFEGGDEDDDSYAPSSFPDEEDFEDAVDDDPIDVEDNDDDES